MKPEQMGNARIDYQGRIFEVVKTPMRIGEKEIEFEKVRRAPGVRLMIVEDGKMLLNKEYRSELGGYDVRLPGGKVFDALEDFKAFGDGDVLKAAEEAAIREAKEETGCVPKALTHIHTTAPGATVEWDLYYFLVDDFEMCKPKREDGEVIESSWYALREVKEMLLNKSIQEDRSVGVLFRYLEDVL